MKEFLEIGKITTTQGLKGEVRVQPFCDYVEDLIDLTEVYLDNNGKEQLKVQKSRVQKNIAVLKFFDINTIEEAEKLKNVTLYVNRNIFVLDENEFFIQDILGLPVIDFYTKEEYGKVVDITNYGASDIYHIKNSDGKVYLVPAINDVDMDINLDERIIYIKPIKGLLDDEN